MEVKTNRTSADAYLKKSLVDNKGKVFPIEGISQSDDWMFNESKDGKANVVASAMIAKQQAYLDDLAIYEALSPAEQAKTDAPVEPTFTLQCRIHIPVKREEITEAPSF